MTDDQIGDALRDLLLSGGNRAARSRTPTAVDLDQALVDHVANRLDAVAPSRDRGFDRSVAWDLLVAAVTSSSPEHERDKKLLVAATHMLEMGRDPRDSAKPAPYEDTQALMKSIGVNSATLKRYAGVESNSAKYGKSISFRRYYAAVASGLGVNRDTLRPDKHIESDHFGEAVGRAYQRALRSDDVLLRAAQGHALPVDEAAESDALAPRRVRPLAWVGAGLAAVAVVAVGILVASNIGGAARGAAEAAAGLATIESVASEPPKWTINTAFWVPVGAPLEELEGITDGCADPRARDWLLKYGQYRDHYLFKVRNVSDETIGISNVVSRGTATAPQPGLIVKCSGGGEGGEIEWSVLRLEFGEGVVATLADTTRVSDYFWLNIPPGETSGVLVYPSGEQDFKGTLTVDVAPTSGQVAQLTIPALEEADAARAMEWHAMPSDKRVTLSLPSPGEAATCDVNGTELERCTANALRDAVDTLWEKD
ncbi:hypothetical protein [Microbacterium sp. cx-59]|uniref:hypothetical protein n=1 Tax=Microbacterium sp. cx-59 TaxID=2891207 RepID=UPI001E2C0422|nr:hypothetical protein [Microbacterium sp. cx-59]MCC4907775.1 hypothetical protein [Microbacterium sp. cx-59]